MKFRLARHTTDLKIVTDFYRDILGLEVLGSFNDHDGYDGIFLGIPGADWHLEFTVSDTMPNHATDEDDYLVFYVKSKDEQDAIREKCIQHHIPLLTSKNPYWNKNGLIFCDPDQYGIIVALAN
jgi:catechol 2,3-dioxygenase-like lactoylglutathione lyase family enzyme